MSEPADLTTWVAAPAWQAPPPSLLEADAEHVAVDDRPDPLDAGFVLAAGLLAPLPPRVRLPHEDDDADDDGEPPVR